MNAVCQEFLTNLRTVALALAFLLHVSPSRAEPAAVTSGKNFSFPRDHGSHSEFKTEWWYFTGNLYEKGKVPFTDTPLYGYQLTFFRRQDDNGSQVYLAHAAITDIKKNTHRQSAIISPPTFSFAGAEKNTLKVWNRDWSAQLIDDQIVLKSDMDDLSLQMILDASAYVQPILQGDHGFSKKGMCETCASYYTSFSRLPSKATLIENNGEPVNLTGLSWMDHEVMSHSLQEDQTGWDWFSLINKNGTELMLFKVRNKDDNASFYAGSCIKGSKIENLSKDDITITATKTWSSPTSHATYPVAWNVAVPKCNFSASIGTRINDQEMRFAGGDGDAPTYYEGAIFSADEHTIGYVEMTGYDKQLQGL